ncbi:MAG: fused MFS/spermidine synthase, partial [Thermodesulfobacteriota bacterium]|nr:fused MFS/spermidine synthase [Thermodesulfobacteriota bacterium]
LGAVFAVNTIGGVCGAVAAAFLLIPILGFYKSSLLLPGINLLAGGVILVAALKGFRAVTAAVVLIFMAVMGGRAMPPDYYSLKYGELEPGHKLIYYHEGLAATATIFQRPEGTRALYLNGIPEVDTSLVSIRTFKLMGALPGLLREKTGRTLIVTFGAGVTAGTAAHFADRIDCVDLVEQAGDIAPFFALANNNIAENKKFHMYVDDARHLLQTTNNKYSVIICDATHPRSYDSWILFTAEFYRLAQKRLEADGIFCQWVPFHGLDLDQYMAIIKTFSHVFPHTTIWTVGRSYSLLMAMPEPFSLDFRAFQKRLSHREVRRDLMQVGLDNPFEFLAHFAMGEKQVRKMTAAYPQVITDDSPAHLFFPSAATLEEQYRKWPETNFNKLISRRESVLPYLTNIGRTGRDKAGITDMIRLYERKRRW